MVTKLFEADDCVWKYDIDARKRTATIVDHTGREVTINHLWFFDLELTHKITNGSMMFYDVVQWYLDNKETLREVDLDRFLCEIFFDTTNPSESLLSNWENFKVPRQRALSTRSQLLLVEFEQEPNRPKLVHTVIGFNYIAKLDYIVTDNHVSSESVPNDSKWGKVMNYSFKMNPTEYNFFRRTERDVLDCPMFGFELEISSKISEKEINYIVQHVEPKQEPFFIFKQDSSISGQYSYMLELVTVPCSYRYLKKAWKIFFTKLERLCQNKGLSLSDVVDCSAGLSNGIHIHVAKDSFYSDLHQRKFLTIFNQWDSRAVSFLTKISGRPTKYTENRFCPVDSAYNGYTLARRLRNRGTSSRSVCHSGNTATVEVRLFQGIFNLDHITRCLEFTEAMREYSDVCPFSSISRTFTEHFTEFVTKSSGFRNLKEFIKCA